MNIKKRIDSLRNEMKKNNINYYIIPSSDAHGSEYVADYYKSRAYMSGFTGSAGTLLVGLDKAILWTDGRYFIQAQKQLYGSGIEMYKMRTPGWPTLEEYLEDNIKFDETIGFDGRTYQLENLKKLNEIVDKKCINLRLDLDLVDKIWIDRPSLPSEKAFIHDIKYSGKSASEKLKEVREIMEKRGVENYIISSLDDIAWIFNIRGNDVKCNPVVLSYAIVTLDNAILFVDLDKFTEEDKKALLNEGIELKPYDEILKYVRILEGSIFIDPNKTNASIYTNINSEATIIEELNITTKLKAVKNEVEIKNLKACQVKDGVAMVRFTKWLKENIGKIKISEISASDKLESFRSELELFKGLSFDTIASHKEHGAMMHYFATEETDYNLEDRGFLLVDSGGQYLDGTTDITRTFVLGQLTDEEKRDFTLVLKGHINLMRTRFLKGTTGSNLDIMARKPLWDEGVDYKCGTGHGVGFFLNVHEGPQSISPVPNKISLEPGMILTNEPGIYREGKHGIRTENTMLVVEDSNNNEFGEFYKFEVISFCPIDLDGILAELLTEEEKEWLNNYHKLVYETLKDYLNLEEKEFLKEVTVEL